MLKKVTATNLLALALCVGAAASLSAALPATAARAPKKVHCKVPFVVGRTLVAAKTGIRKAHCQVGTVRYLRSTASKKNRVLSQRPGRGRKLVKGAKVNLVVGRESVASPPPPAPPPAPGTPPASPPVKVLQVLRGRWDNLQRLPAHPSETPPPSGSPNALRMDLSGAVALAQPQPGTLSSTATPQAQVAARSLNAVSALEAGATAANQSGVAVSSTAVSSSTLEAIDPYGEVSPAFVSGSADVNQFIVGPDGKVYILFRGPVNLDDTTQYGNCLLAEIDVSTGVPTCVDNTLSYISWPQPHSGQNPAIQFDGAGAVYYSGHTSDGRTVLRKYFDGAVTDLINQNINLNDFLVLNDGGVVFTGTTTSTSAPWLRYLSASGSLHGLAAQTSNWLRLFPDGNVYVGLTGGTGSTSGVMRFLTATEQLESKPWINSSLSASPPASMYFDVRDICSPDLWMPRQAFCGWSGGVLQDSFTTHEGKVLGIAGSSFQGGMLMQYYPSVAVGTTAVQKIYDAQSAGNDLVLSGLNSAGQNITNLYDTATGLEAPIFDATHEMEIYHLTYVPETHKMLFDGLRFSDNKYVFGEIDFS